MKKNSKWIYGLMVILIVFFSVFMLNKPKASKEDAQKGRTKQALKVDAIVIKPSKLVNEISVSGTLLAYDEVELKNEVAGRVVKINLPEGKFVKKETLLVKLFDDDLQANLKKLLTQKAIQEKIFDRQAELLKVNGISQNDYEQTGLQLNSIKADIEIEKARIRKTEVLAPFDGVIGLRNISVGAQITPSTLVATIRSIDKIRLDFSVPEKYGPAIKPGMKVNFTLNNEDHAYTATVIATEQGIDEVTRNLKVRALVNSRSSNLIPGSFTVVSLHLGENKGALMVPTEAVIPREKSKELFVARQGKAHLVEVRTGVREASQIEITEGIQPGDTVLTSGMLFLREGAKILYSAVNTASL